MGAQELRARRNGDGRNRGRRWSVGHGGVGCKVKWQVAKAHNGPCNLIICEVSHERTSRSRHAAHTTHGAEQPSERRSATSCGGAATSSAGRIQKSATRGEGVQPRKRAARAQRAGLPLKSQLGSLRPQVSQSLATPELAMLSSLVFFSPLRQIPTSAAARRSTAAAAITMRDRSKNRKPTQRGRYLSTEAIQAVQSLKRASLRGAPAAGAVAVEPKLRRLLKADMVAVFRELAAQGEALLALQVFEEIRKEHWYKPRLLWYVDLITVFASKGLRSEVGKACSYLKREQLEPDTDGFNLLLKALLDAEFTQLTMDCFRLMKLWDSEPDRITYRTLIKGLESLGEMDLSGEIRLEAENDYGDHLDFLDEEDMVETYTSSS